MAKHRNICLNNMLKHVKTMLFQEHVKTCENMFLPAIYRTCYNMF